MIHYVVTSFGMGIISGIFVLLFFAAIRKMNLYTVDGVSAIGSLLTQKDENARIVGSIFHILGAIFYTFIYFLVFRLVPVPKDAGSWIYPVLGLGLGFNHGMLAALVLGIILTRFHSMEKYRKLGFGIAIIHSIAHIFYGIVVAILYIFTI